MSSPTEELFAALQQLPDDVKSVQNSIIILTASLTDLALQSLLLRSR